MVDLLQVSSHVYHIFGYAVSIGELSMTLLLVVILGAALRLSSLGVFSFADKGADVSRGLRREQATERGSLDSICSPQVAERDERVLNPISFRPFTVIAIESASHNTVTIRFEIPADKDGIKVLRPYTPTSRPDTKGMCAARCVLCTARFSGGRATTRIDDLLHSIMLTTPFPPRIGHFELLVKKYADGKMSSHIGQLRVGDMLEFRGPVGRFKYAPNQYKRIGLIAGGTGLTPCLQVRGRCDVPVPCNPTLALQHCHFFCLGVCRAVYEYMYMCMWCVVHLLSLPPPGR